MAQKFDLDRAVARVKYEWASKAAVAIPPLGRLIFGDNPVLWRVADNRASQISGWKEAEGCEESGRFPWQYQASLVMATNLAILERQAKSWNAQPAAAFMEPGKETVLITTLPFIERTTGPEDGNLKVILGIGEGACIGTVGVACDRMFVPALSDISYERIDQPPGEVETRLASPFVVRV